MCLNLSYTWVRVWASIATYFLLNYIIHLNEPACYRASLTRLAGQRIITGPLSQHVGPSDTNTARFASQLKRVVTNPDHAGSGQAGPFGVPSGCSRRRCICTDWCTQRTGNRLLGQASAPTPLVPGQSTHLAYKKTLVGCSCIAIVYNNTYVNYP
jgi:hypothetical protein